MQFSTGTRRRIYVHRHDDDDDDDGETPSWVRESLSHNALSRGLSLTLARSLSLCFGHALRKTRCSHWIWVYVLISLLQRGVCVIFLLATRGKEVYAWYSVGGWLGGTRDFPSSRLIVISWCFWASPTAWFHFGLQRLCRFLGFAFFMPFQARPWIAERRTSRSGWGCPAALQPHLGVCVCICICVKGGVGGEILVRNNSFVGTTVSCEGCVFGNCR